MALSKAGYHKYSAPRVSPLPPLPARLLRAGYFFFAATSCARSFNSGDRDLAGTT
jgi:hypothetical protein